VRFCVTEYNKQKDSLCQSRIRNVIS